MSHRLWLIVNEYNFENFSKTAEELKHDQLSSEEAYLMLESRIVDLFNEKVFFIELIHLRLGDFWCPGVYGFYLSESARRADSKYLLGLSE